MALYVLLDVDVIVITSLNLLYVDILHVAQAMFALLDLCVSSLRRGHANLLRIVPILTNIIFINLIYINIFLLVLCLLFFIFISDDPRMESDICRSFTYGFISSSSEAAARAYI